MPSPNELTVLRIAKEEGEISKRRISRRLEITTEYADYMLRCLMRHGYLEKNGRNGCYCLTPQGGEALLSLLVQIRGKLTARIRWEAWLKERAEQRIAELAGFLEKEFPSERGKGEAA